MEGSFLLSVDFDPESDGRLEGMVEDGRSSRLSASTRSLRRSEMFMTVIGLLFIEERLEAQGGSEKNMADLRVVCNGRYCICEKVEAII